MLSLPARGFQRSTVKHRIDLDLFADWLEGSALFTDVAVSGGDIVDILRESDFYETQAFAWEFVNDVFLHIKRRSMWMGENYPFLVRNGIRLTRKAEWKEFAPYAFCLTLSLKPLYPTWAQAFGNDYTLQGELFETLTAEAMQAHYIGWTVITTGWTRSATKKLARVVSDVCSSLGETSGELRPWSKASANEAGLDLVCFRAYEDARGGFPAYLIQCASGNDWQAKLKTPDLRVWKKIVLFSNDPKKGFSMPFALSKEAFQRNCNIVDGLLLDRYRLLAPGINNPKWVTEDTAVKMNTWTESRVLSLPLLDTSAIN
jgi:hypothetical protein